MREYKLQVRLPYQDRSANFYLDTGCYWNTVAESGDLAHLQQQADIMREYWKHVRVVLPESVVIEQRVMY